MINAIRQSLMQYETVGKSPGGSSPSAGGGAGAGAGAGAGGGAGSYGVHSPGRASPEPRERWRALQGCGLGAAAGALYADPARARALVEQQRARLLQLQRSQQMLVSPEVRNRISRLFLLHRFSRFCQFL